MVTSERDQSGELDTLSKENQELDQMSEKMKEKIRSLNLINGSVCISKSSFRVWKALTGTVSGKKRIGKNKLNN